MGIDRSMMMNLMILVVIAYIVLAYYFVRKRRKIVIERGDVGNAIDVGDIIAMPRELVINIVEDTEIDYAVYSDITIKISELLSGKYKIPEKFFKSGVDVITAGRDEKVKLVAAEGMEEKVERKSDVNMSMFENLEQEEEDDAEVK